jgi:hypothetical protein
MSQRRMTYDGFVDVRRWTSASSRGYLTYEEMKREKRLDWSNAQRLTPVSSPTCHRAISYFQRANSNSLLMQGSIRQIASECQKDKGYTVGERV